METRVLLQSDTCILCALLLALGAGAGDSPSTGVLGAGKKARGSSRLKQHSCCVQAAGLLQ
jgi:hypothetical protein